MTAGPRCPDCRHSLSVSVVAGVYVLGCRSGHEWEQRRCACGELFWVERGANGRPATACQAHRRTEERPPLKVAAGRR